MALHINKVTASEALDKLHIMIYAEPGMGKTVLAGSSPNALIIRPSTDGTESLPTHGYEPDELVADDWETMVEAYEMLASNPDRYEWVWLDSISLFQEMGLDSIMTQLVADKPHRDEFTPGIENYGENMNRISKWVRQMRKLPINFGITAHVMRNEDHDGEVRYMPHIQGKNMTEKISAYMGIVGALMMAQTSDGEQRRILRVQPHGKWYGKDRFNITDKGFIVDPTIPKIMELIEAAGPDAATKSRAAKKRPRRRPSNDE